MFNSPITKVRAVASTWIRCISTSRTTYQTFHPPRLQGKVAIVTGASSGLGRAIALQFASHGTRLIVCADLQSQPRQHGEESTSKSTVDTIEELYGIDTAIFAKTDVNNSVEVKRAVDLATSHGERLDILVNCAGVGNVSGSPLLHELEENDWDRVVDVNLRGTYITNKFALRQMMHQQPRSLSTATGEISDRPRGGEKNIGLMRRGTIINVSSMLGSIALPDGTAPYCASKGGVLNLTRQLALDYSPSLININALCPGFLKSAMTAGNRRTLQQHDGENARTERDTPELTGEKMRCATPFGEWGRAEDIARMAVSLASEDGAWVSGAEIIVDGGYSAGGFGGVAAMRDPRLVRQNHEGDFKLR